MKILTSAICSLLISLLGNSLCVAEVLQVEITGTDRTQKFSFASVSLPKSFHEYKSLSLTETTTKNEIPVQVDRSGQIPQAVWIIDHLAPKEKRTYELTAPNARTTKAVPQVIVEDDSKHLNVRYGKKKILSYNHALVKSPIPNAPYYARSGYIHPVYTPKGDAITDDFNPDHAHQHGIMFAWRQMKFKGRIFDPWNQKKKLGRIEHVKILSTENGNVFGRFVCQLKHIDHTAPEGEESVLDEIWNVRIFAIGESFLFDITSTQTCASKTPVSVEKIHYGGMAFRGRASWFDDQSFEYITSEGKTKSNGNHTKPHWVNISGPIENSYAGVTIFSHTDNFRSPQFVRLHPKMPYFCFPPSVEESFTITPEKPYVSRYRFHVHSGKYDKELSQSIFESFTNPPETKTRMK